MSLSVSNDVTPPETTAAAEDKPKPKKPKRPLNLACVGIAKRVAQKRAELGLEVVDVARLAGISRSFVDHLETGRLTESFLHVSRVAEVLDMPLAYLIDGTFPRTRPKAADVADPPLADLPKARPAKARPLPPPSPQVAFPFLPSPKQAQTEAVRLAAELDAINSMIALYEERCRELRAGAVVSCLLSNPGETLFFQRHGGSDAEVWSFVFVRAGREDTLLRDAPKVTRYECAPLLDKLYEQLMRAAANELPRASAALETLRLAALRRGWADG